MIGLLRRPAKTSEANEATGADLLRGVRIGDVVEFDWHSDDHRRAVYGGPIAGEPGRFRAVDSQGRNYTLSAACVTGVVRRVTGRHPFEISDWDRWQYDRLSANGKAYYNAIRREFGWHHYSAYTHGSAAGRIR